MKEYLAHLVGASRSTVAGRNVAREYLQARILEGLQRCAAMVPLAFQGGTALRFLHAVPRYSEDLDFTLERREAPYDLRGWVGSIRTALAGEGYAVEARAALERTVHSAVLRFPGLPHELALSPRANEVLAVRIEVDTNPPAGAVLETTVVRRHVLLQLQHHDRASLLAGKLHAVLQREYAKGRDLYDLLWYLSAPEWPAPNLGLLNNALRQTGWIGGEVSADSWRAVLRERIEALDWRRVVEDARPFLEDSEAADLLTRQNLVRLLARR